jgi:dGTPase
LIQLSDLDGLEIWSKAAAEVYRPGMNEDLFRTGVIRHLIDWQVRDMVAHTLSELRRHRITSVDDVRGFSGVLVSCSPTLQPMKAQLEEFLHARVYRHFQVMRMKYKGCRVLRALFAEFCRHPELLPEHFVKRREGDPLPRIVGDYLAGMTDRFAQQEYLRLFHPLPDV